MPTMPMITSNQVMVGSLIIIELAPKQKYRKEPAPAIIITKSYQGIEFVF